MQGPTIKVFPSRRMHVCNGCDYLDKTPAMRGHKKVTDNYGCTHPDFAGERGVADLTKGRTIVLSSEYPCVTPSWCPILTIKPL